MVEKKSIMKKIAILTNIIPPYRLPLFNGIAKTHKLDVLICKENEENRNWKIESNNLFNIVKLRGIDLTLRNSLGDYRFIYLKFTVVFYLLFKRPDYIIIGDASFTSYLTAFFCKILHIKYMWWNEVLPFTPISKGFVDKLRAYSIRNANHHFVSGTLAKEFIKSYGIKESSITIIPDAIDNDKYFSLYKKYKSQRDKLREEYKIKANEFVFLYVGQFIKRKNIILMLEAFYKAYKEDNNLKFILVGGGEEFETIKKFVKVNNLENSIITKEFVEIEELSQIYTISDSLIIVSESEPWGMIVNEAMCFGLPILASYTVGASADLVDEKSGIVVEEYNDCDILYKNMLKIKDIQWDCNYIQKKVLNWNNEIGIKRISNDI